MLLGWLHDHRQSDRPGGAQLSSEAMAQASPEWAEVVMCYPGEMADCDCYVLNNVKFFSYQELMQATEGPYIVYEHDHWNTVQKWQPGMIRSIIHKAEAVVFLSPMHRKTFCSKHDVMPHRAYAVPSPIDVTLWDPHWAKWGTVWMGSFWPQKGIAAACEWAAENGWVRFYGSGPLTPQGPNVEVHGQVPYSDVPRILAMAKRFLFLPASEEPFGRVVAEAALSGCELICNDNVGALSWGWNTLQDWRKGIGSAPTTFWEIMAEVLQ